MAAIVTASTGVINILLPKLSMLIEGEYKLQKGVRSKITFLKNELISMQTLLVKLANNEERLDEQLKDWRNKVRELSYDIEDCIDLFMHKMSKGADKASLIKKTVSKIEKIWSRRKIAKLIDELKARVEEESGRRLRYKQFDDQATNFTNAVHIDPRLPALYEEVEKLVGIDGPREEIIKLLENDDNGHQLRVVSIVGFGGLGKTTLANQVYRKIKGQFSCSCFVPVSRNPNVAKILANMLKELGSDVDQSDDERQLIDKLRAFLQDKRYFIVVDDIWSTEAWKHVKSALPENSLNSRIITTTRISEVARSCCIGLAGYVHDIKPLSDQQSQQLFFKRVFGNNSSCPPHLEQVSFEIIKKCRGLPLAIITVGSLLVARKSNKDQWEQVCNSIGSVLSHERMRDIILLSYYDLPYHLKTCLLYLSMYREDYEIQTEDLIWRWIAEGFITEERGQTVYQVAKSYFNELVNRNLILPTAIQCDGQVEYFRVHDMVLDLIVSLSIEENFTSIVEGQSYNGSGHLIRRLSVQKEHVGDEVMQKIMDKWSQVRSIIFYEMQELGISHLHELHNLRVLILYCGRRLGNQHIKYIGSLFQLKFLTLGYSSVTELPEDIGKLRYLQILDISDSAVKKLPPSIGHLQNLVRLLVRSSVELPDEIGDLQALQELSGAMIFSSKLVEALGRLAKLKTLDMDVPSREELGSDIGRYKEALKSSFAKIGNGQLQSLTIFDDSDTLSEELMDILCRAAPRLWKLDVFGHGIARFPKQVASLVNLTHLSLRIVRVKQEDLCIIGGIPALLFCELNVMHAPDERLVISSQLFRCLKEFRYINTFYGGGLEMLFLQEAMPELRRLELQFRAQEAESKMGFEFSFEHLPSLEHIKVAINTEAATWSRVEATRSRVEAAEAAVRGAVSMHPGSPVLDMCRKGPLAERSEIQSELEYPPWSLMSQTFHPSHCISSRRISQNQPNSAKNPSAKQGH